MRKAMFVSGHLRSLAETAAKIMQSRFDGDVFATVWDHMDCTPHAPPVDREKVMKYLNATKLEILPFEPHIESMKKHAEYFEIKTNTHTTAYKGRKLEDTFCMWYLMWRSWQLLKSHGIRYDLVVRSRPDYIFEGLHREFKAEPETVYFPSNLPVDHHNVTDNLFFADYDTMDKMMTLPLLLETYFIQDKVAVVPEFLVNHHLKEQKLNKVIVKGLTYSGASGLPPGSDGAVIDMKPRREMIVATMVTKNDEDIIGECIRHTINQGVNKIIITDNDSSDDTRKIATSFPEVQIIDEPGAYNHAQWQTRMAGIAMLMGASWVVPIKADELWSGMTNLMLVPEDFAVVVVGRVYVHRPTDLIKEPFSLGQMPFFEIDHSGNGKLWGTGRFAFRPSANIKLEEKDNHFYVTQAGVSIGILQDLIYIHRYPVRSYQRYINKIKTIVKSLSESRYDYGLEWRVASEKLADHTLESEYNQLMIKTQT